MNRTVNVKAFAAAMLTLLTSRKGITYFDASQCLIGLAYQAATGQPYQSVNNATIPGMRALGIDHETYTHIFVQLQPRKADNGRTVLSNRTVRRNIVIRGIKALTKGQPNTPELALLQTVYELLTNPEGYNQSDSTVCVVGTAYKSLTGNSLYGTLREKRQALVSEGISEDLLSDIFWDNKWPENLRKRFSNAKTQRTKAYIAALRTLTALAQGV